MMTMPTAMRLPPTPEPFPDQLAPNSAIPDITQQDFPALHHQKGHDNDD